MPLESLADGGRGTDTHDRRIAAADSPAEELAERLEPALVGELPGGDDQRSGAVADSARGTRVDDAVLLEHLGQLGERFDGGVRAVVLVAAEVDRLALLARELDGGELVGEASRFLGRGEAPLRENAVLVHLALRDAVLGSEVLRGHRHGKAVVTVGQPLPERVLELGRLAETDAETQPTGDVRGLGHALGPAHERALRIAGEDLECGVDHCLEARPAKPVHRERRHVLRKSRAQAYVASEIDGVRAGLEHVAEDDVVHVLGGHLGLGERCLRGMDGEVGRGHVLERTAICAEGGALRSQKDDLGRNGLHLWLSGSERGF